VKKKSELKLECYRQLGKKLYQVRHHGKTIRFLLSNDPSPSFEKDVVDAVKAFRDACDTLQTETGNNRIMMSKQAVDRIADVISASADLIEGLKCAMSRTVSADQVVRDLGRQGGLFERCLDGAEKQLAREVDRL